ncbi:hypothetical protein Fcan01_25388 [Folsomia candida]|uniref:Uncharacterized protein n=1 Tax=Folsomia candida TaxID=158441 RepID=A0A226D6Q9_FOLCA|nr:hypothetical protein Fcan01_25388 [Folsomia candida]
MSKDYGFSNFTKKYTRPIWKHLPSSTVRLNGSNFVPATYPRHDDNFPLKIEGDNSSPELSRSSCCSICPASTNLRPLALQEVEILAKFVLNQEQISLILQTDHHPPILCCKICSSAIHSLAKLSTQIENIAVFLRASISIGDGLFNKGRNQW